nr:MAG TPA: hypothetical protein [Caudoviricetes sp.]
MSIKDYKVSKIPVYLLFSSYITGLAIAFFISSSIFRFLAFLKILLRYIVIFFRSYV